MLIAVLVQMISGTGDVQTQPAESVTYVAPLSEPASFSPRPELWGLDPLPRGTALTALDDSLVLYLDQRSLFQIESTTGQVHLVRGAQLTGAIDPEQDIDEFLSAHGCLCTFDYEAPVVSGGLHIAAGAYRLASPPSISEEPSGITRIEFVLLTDGQSDRAQLRRLVCWNAVDDSVGPLMAALPPFVRMTRKSNPAFSDPPVDDRKIERDLVAERSRSRGADLAIADHYLGFGEYRDVYDNRSGSRFDAPDMQDTARPGLTTWIRSFQPGGSRLSIDYSDYPLDMGRDLRRRDRRDGIHFRDPTFWP